MNSRRMFQFLHRYYCAQRSFHYAVRHNLIGMEFGRFGKAVGWRQRSADRCHEPGRPSRRAVKWGNIANHIQLSGRGALPEVSDCADILSKLTMVLQNFPESEILNSDLVKHHG